MPELPDETIHIEIRWNQHKQHYVSHISGSEDGFITNTAIESGSRGEAIMAVADELKRQAVKYAEQKYKEMLADSQAHFDRLYSDDIW